MERRAFISAGVVGLTGLAGCLGDGDPDDGTVGDSAPSPTDTPTADTTSTTAIDPTPEPTEALDGPRNADDLPEDPDPDDGYPPEFSRRPAERSFDADSFETVFVSDGNIHGADEGRDVPLAPIEATYYWYARGEARFVDARSEAQFDRTQIYGAVSSPAPYGDDSDPVAEWPTADRIVCYCGCPHTLSAIRAANLLEAGFEEVYVIDEGLGEWHDRGYPMAGTNVDERPAEYVIEGVTDPASSGDRAWVTHEPSDQRSSGVIASDGSYTVEFGFEDLGIGAVVAVETPEYRVETPLVDAIDTVIRPPAA